MHGHHTAGIMAGSSLFHFITDKSGLACVLAAVTGMPPDSLARLYDAHAPALYRFLLSLSGSEADTRDLLQEVFVKVARREEKEINDPAAYLFRAARNAFTDLVRRNSHRRDTLDRYLTQLDPAGPCDSSEDSGGGWDTGHGTGFPIAMALADLPEEQRAVVHLKIWEDLTFSRISEILGISANTAASRYRYALERLRHSLKPSARITQ